MIYLHHIDFLCGKWGASKCNGERLFKYFGDFENNTYTPLNIQYQFPKPDDKLPSGIIPLNKTTQSCNETSGVSYYILKIFIVILIIKLFFY